MNKANRPFARNLRHALTIKGWSQGQLAHKAKVSQGHISMILREERGPSISIAIALARALDVSLDWLAGLPKRNPNELEPDETELLRLYRFLTPEDKEIVLGSTRLHTRIMEKAE